MRDCVCVVDVVKLSLGLLPHGRRLVTSCGCRWLLHHELRMPCMAHTPHAVQVVHVPLGLKDNGCVVDGLTLHVMLTLHAMLTLHWQC